MARLAMTTFGAQDPRRAAELAEMAVVTAGDDEPARALALRRQRCRAEAEARAGGHLVSAERLAALARL